ncbi:hypothetical protein AAH446_05185 [Erwinia sp. P6884]|uniref:hypothetical protein n=1 Tax=Erwinia sp. P6884 TaxID=3141450 RepID=UPI003196EFB9
MHISVAAASPSGVLFAPIILPSFALMTGNCTTFDPRPALAKCSEQFPEAIN